MNIEHHLYTLKPANQTELARRILAIPAKRRQRRRDCVFGFGGLLTGIAITLLVVMWLPSLDEGRQPTAVTVACGTPHYESLATPSLLSPTLPPGGRQPTLNTIDTTPDPLDLGEWFARYEKLLRHQPIAAYKPTVSPAVALPAAALPDGVSPLEYRKRLLEGEYRSQESGVRSQKSGAALPPILLLPNSCLLTPAFSRLTPVS